MLKKYLIAILFFLFSTALFAANRNIRHNPEHIFERVPSGHQAVNSKRTTGIEALHAKGFKGRGTKIAFVDQGIHPDVIGELRSKIHPHVFQNKYVLTPEEKLEQINSADLEAKYNRTVDTFNALPSFLRLKQEDQVIKELNKFSHQIDRKRYYDTINSCKIDESMTQNFLHGVSILRLLHLMVPESQLFPFDIHSIASGLILSTPNHCSFNKNPFILAVEEAIKNKVDIINFSCFPFEFSRGFINVLKEAIHTGIAIIFAAGNASSQNQSIAVDKEKLNDGSFTKSGCYQLFEETSGKGILFAGSLTYNPINGEEAYSEFSQHPTKASLNNYLLAPGESIALKSIKNWYGVYSGTSLSAPTTAAGLALLQEYAAAKGLPYTRDKLMSILQQAGHKLKHHISRVVSADTYNVLNLPNALLLADKTLAKQSYVVEKPETSVKRPRVVRSSKPVIKKTEKPPSKKKTHTLKKRKESKKARKKAIRANKKRKKALRKARAARRKQAAGTARVSGLLPVE